MKTKRFIAAAVLLCIAGLAFVVAGAFGASSLEAHEAKTWDADYALARAFAEEQLRSVMASRLAGFPDGPDGDYVRAEDLTIGEGFRLLGYRDMRDESLDAIAGRRTHDLDSLLELDGNDWLFVINNNGKPEFYVTIRMICESYARARGGEAGGFRLGSFGGNARGFGPAYAKFRAAFPYDEARILHDKRYVFLSEDSGSLMEIPLNPDDLGVGFDAEHWDGHLGLILDSEAVVQIFIDRIMELRRMEESGEPLLFGGEGLTEAYVRRARGE